MRYSALFILAFLVTVASQASERQHIAPSELSLGGITIGLSEDAVVKRLGNPTSRLKTDEGYKLTYAGIEIYVGVGAYGVFDLVSTNPVYCTPSHICPGMPISKLHFTFGPAIEVERENGKFLEYIPFESTCWLQIRESNGIIKSIRIACQP